MNLTNLILIYYTESDIEILNEKLQAFNEKIELIDSNMKFNIQVFIALLSLAIAIIGIAGYNGIKKWIDEQIKKDILLNVEKIINNAPKYEVISGVKRLNNNDLKDGKYVFVVAGSDFSIRFGIDNFISIRPISGEKELKYKAEVTEGKLSIEFKNFNSEEDKGVKWKILYMR